MCIYYSQPKKQNMNRNLTLTRRFRLRGMGCLATLAALIATSALGQLNISQQAGTKPIAVTGATVNCSTNTIQVSNVLGAVENITITLNGISHNYIADLGVLLVHTNSAGTNSIVLLNGVGETNSTANQFTGNLIFSNTVTTLPSLGAINPGVYKPTDYVGEDFVSPAPAGPYGLTVASLGAIDPNGSWTLYVQNAYALSSGSITSWSIQLWTKPVIGTTSNTVSLVENTTNTFTFFVTNTTPNVKLTNSLSAVGTATGSFTNGAIATWDSTNSIGITNIVQGTYTFFGAKNYYGTNTFSIIVGDGLAKVTNSGLNFEVSQVNQSPTNWFPSGGTNSTYFSGSTTNIPFLIGDYDNDANNLTVTVQSTNPAIPASAVYIVPGPRNANAGGPGTAQSIRTNTVVVTPVLTAPISNGLAMTPSTNVIQFVVDDGVSTKFTNNLTIVVTNLLGHSIWANTNSITFNPTDANPLGTKSDIIVSNLNSTVGKVVVGLQGLSNYLTTDFQAILQHGAANAWLLTNVGDIHDPATGYYQGDLVFDDASVVSAITASKTTNYSIAPFQSLKNNFAGVDPNGTWSLLLTNLGGLGTNISITNGWTLRVYTSPVISNDFPSATVTMAAETITNIVFGINDFDGTNATAPTLTYDSSIVTITKGITTTNTAYLSITGKPYMWTCGTNMPVSVTLTDNSGLTVTKTFNLLVTFSNHTPYFTTVVPRQNTYAGEATDPILFTYTDPDLTNFSGETLNVTATSSDNTLLPDGNIIITKVGYNPTTYTYTNSVQLFPVGNAKAGASSVVTLTLADKAQATKTLAFSLQINGTSGWPAYNATSVSVLYDEKHAGSFYRQATIYPSINTVPTFTGKIASVEVSVFGLNCATNATNLNFVLVGPATNNLGQRTNAVVLMSGAGSNCAINGASLVFKYGATNTLPTNSAIGSGLYSAMNTSLITTIPNTNSAGTVVIDKTSLLIGTDLNSFAGIDPSGDWMLFVYDSGLDTPCNAKFAGWQLNIKTSPNVISPGNVFMTENVPANVAITIGDTNLSSTVNVVSGYLSNNVVVDPSTVISSIVITGTGGTRNLYITPQTNTPASGSTNQVVYIVATDTNSTPAISSSNAFTVYVSHKAQAPIISAATTNLTNCAGLIVGPVQYVAQDVHGKPMVVSYTTDNPKLIPLTNIFDTANSTDLTYNSLTNSIQFVPVGMQTGTANIGVSVTNSEGAGSSLTFCVVITNAPFSTFNVSNSIAIGPGFATTNDPNNNGSANPYPAVTNITGLHGTVAGIRVVVDGFKHDRPSDVSMLLVAPDKTSVVLMSHVGGGQDNALTTGTRLVFDSTGVSMSASKITNGVYRPTLLGTVPVFATNGDSTVVGGNSTDLTKFANVAPNGNWKLYVLDDNYPLSGAISGWTLYLTLSPALDPIASFPMNENGTTNVSFTVYDDSLDPATLTITARADTESLFANNSSSIVVNSKTITLTPIPNQPSFKNRGTNETATITVVATDINNKTATQTFKVTVTNINQAPIVTTTTNIVSIDENGTANLSFSVIDQDSKLFKTNFRATWAATDKNTALIDATAGAVFSTNSSTFSDIPYSSGVQNIQFSVKPATNVYGSNIVVSLIVKDLSNAVNVVTSSVTLYVKHVYQAPWIQGIAYSNNIPAGSASAVYSFSVKSPEVDASKLTVSVTSNTNTTLIPDANISLTAPDANGLVYITLVPVGVNPGTNEITLTVKDTVANLTTPLKFIVTVGVNSGQVVGNNAAEVKLATNSASLDSYKSTVKVINRVGELESIQVILQGLYASDPANIDLLLVHTNATTTNAVMLMSGAGADKPASNLRVVFDDIKGKLLSLTDSITNNSTNQVAYYSKPKRTLGSPAPDVAYYSASLTNLGGIDPNGDWTLYFYDSVIGDTGTISNGWALSIITKPVVTLTNTVAGMFKNTNSSILLSNAFTITPSDESAVWSNMSLSVTSDNTNVTYKIVTNKVVNNYTIQLFPGYLYSGSNNITFSVTRTNDKVASLVKTVGFVVTNLNVLPTASSGYTVHITEDSTSFTNLDMIIGDVDTPLSMLSVTATSDHPEWIAASNLQFTASGSNSVFGLAASGKATGNSQLSLLVRPNPTQAGTNIVTVVVTDGVPQVGTNTVSIPFTVIIDQTVYHPGISTIQGRCSVRWQTVQQSRFHAD